MDHTLVSIITVNYNGYKDTCEMIESLRQHETCPYEVIVVDNASRGNDAALLQQKNYPDVTVVASSDNLGFAGGSNLGTQHAKGEYILYLNNDIVIDRPFLDALVGRMNASPKVGLVSGKILYEHHRTIIQYAGYTQLTRIRMKSHQIGQGEEDLGQHDQASVTGSAHGACMLTSRHIIEEVGLMTDIYFLFYEELDWSFRIQQAGYELWYEPAAVVYHKEGMSIRKNSPLRNYYLSRNRLIYTRRNGQGFEKTLSLLYLTFLTYPVNILRSVASAYWDNISALTRGLRDGWIQQKI